MLHCPNCPVRSSEAAAAPVTVRRAKNNLTWTLVSDSGPVHLAALFRDPAIRDYRHMPTVLDLWTDIGGRLAAGRRCWLRPFLLSIGSLAAGLTIALDNGVRCPCPKSRCDYQQRAEMCSDRTQAWLDGLQHFDGGSLGVLVCDRDLAIALSRVGRLTTQDGSTWLSPRRYLNTLGERIRVFDRPGLLCPHPVVVARSATYRRALSDGRLAEKILELARV